MFAAHQFGSGPDDLVFSSPLDFPTTGTLAVAPTPLPQPFLGVFETSAAAAWVALPGTPLSDSASGYILEASSTNFDGTGTVYSSTTLNVVLSTLTVGGPGGLLERNATYYFRVGSRNPFGAPNYAALGATVTLTNTVAASFSGVFVTSVAASWPPLPTSPPALRDATAEGYSFEASSTNFGALAPGGVVFSSRTAVIPVGQLTIAGLTPYVTYFFRVGTLNWGGAGNYAVLGAAVPTIFKPFGVATAGDSQWVAWADYDRDGDLDAVVANTSAQNEVRLDNTGGDSFSQSGLAATADNTNGIAWADYDNDGDLDALVGNYGNQDESVLRNDGGGVFTKLPLTGSGGDSGAVAWGTTTATATSTAWRPTTPGQRGTAAQRRRRLSTFTLTGTMELHGVAWETPTGTATST